MAKFDLYQEITNRIMDDLNNNIVPWWEKPWTGVASGAYNIVSKKPYSLLNQLLLQHKGAYASFNQWQKMGGKIKKGHKAEIVVFFKMLPVEEDKKDGTKEKKIIPLLRYINVWNIEDVEFEEGKEPKQLELEEYIHNPIEEAEEIISEYVERDGVTFNSVISNEAFYRPIDHSVTVPCKEQYKDINEYYSTTFHELAHSTSKHLKRPITGIASNKDGYSLEELVAEISSCFLMGHVGIETNKTFKNSEAYIQGWLQALRNDKRLIVKAAGRAEKAVNYILNVNQEESITE